MIVRIRILLPLLLGAALSMPAYTRYTTSATVGTPLRRTDIMNIHWQVNASMVAGATNANGHVVITPNSNPIGAIQAALSQWASVPTAQIGLAPLAINSALENNPADGNSVMTITDTPAHRSVVGDFLAITLFRFDGSGTITDTDIIYNPAPLDGNSNVVAFSTDHTLNTYDLRAVTTHELGHSLGANHSGVVGATMYQNLVEVATFTTVAEATFQSRLSPDDIAFLTTAYPAPGASGLFGRISGAVTFNGGGAIKGGLVQAIDPTSGIAINGITDLNDGSYTIFNVPPGSYRVFAQPLNGPVNPVNLNLASSQVSASFRTTFAGGNASPQIVAVGAGGAATANIAVDTGTPVLQIAYLGTGAAGGSGYAFADIKSATGGGATDVLLWGTGINSSVTESQLVILGGGMKLRSGTLHTQASATVGGLTPIRFTVDVPALSASTYSAIGVINGADASIHAGGLILLANATSGSFSGNGMVNAASYAGGAIAPGEIFTIFGTQLGPSALAYSTLNAAGRVGTSAGGTRVYFDDLPAAMIYASAAQVAGMVPYALAGSQLTNVRVEYNGVSTPTVPILVSSFGVAPSIFSANSSGTGQGAILNQDYSANTAANPAAQGSVIQIYAAGEGQTTPLGVDGLLANGATLPAPQKSVTATVGGASAVVQYAGAAPGFAAGLLQVNVVVPTGIAVGAVPVTIAVNGVSSPAGVTVAVK